jgi:hypothetical protein
MSSEEKYWHYDHFCWLPDAYGNLRRRASDAEIEYFLKYGAKRETKKADSAEDISKNEKTPTESVKNK